MKESVLVLVMVALLIFAVGCSVSQEAETLPSEPPVYTHEELTDDVGQKTAATEPALIIPSGGFDMISPMYAKGYDSISELMEDVTLIVHAVPVSVEGESDFAICYVLEVSQASADGIETIYLRQTKDEHLLEIGQEVVLALAPDEGEGYYHIPAGSAGLFSTNEITAAVEGELLNDLLENSPAPLSANSQITLENVFDLLCKFE